MYTLTYGINSRYNRQCVWQFQCNLILQPLGEGYYIAGLLILLPHHMFGYKYQMDPTHSMLRLLDLNESILHQHCKIKNTN